MLIAGATGVAANSLKMPTTIFIASAAPVACAGEQQLHDDETSSPSAAFDRGRERTRLVAFCANGLFRRPLYNSLAAAGLPPSVRDEVIEALGTTVSLMRDVAEGDGFYVRYEQAFSGDRPVGTGRLLWAEFQSRTRGAIAVHRFRSNDGGERFWTSAGKPATAPVMRLPLTSVQISSGFGMRPDPFGAPTSKILGMGGPPPTPEEQKTAAAENKTSDIDPATKDEPKKETKPKKRRSTMAFSGFGGFAGSSNAGGGDFVNGDRALGREAFREPAPAETDKATDEAKADPKPTSPLRSKLFMHAGVDLVAPAGTPIFAAADGMVKGAHPNGPYGNWVRIDHPGRVTTIYGHLSGYAADVFPGAEVKEGQLIGYVGSTGRSTGAHLHFEVGRNGQAVDPLQHPEMKPPVLNWAELQRFKAQVGKAMGQRGQEVADGSLAAE